MKKKNRPSQFLKLGEFDLTFESILPEDYIDNLRDEARLRYRNIELRHLLDNSQNEADDLAHPSTFTLESGSKTGTINATGMITYDAIGETRVHGYFRMNYDFLTLNYMFVAPIFLAVFSDTPLEFLIGWSMVIFVFFVIEYAVVLYTKDMLLEHLQDPRHLLKVTRARNPYLDV